MAKEKEKKLFVLDTNVILHDHTCIRKFEEHDVLIVTTVLEELDAFKKGNDAKAFNVRHFHRELDELRKIREERQIGSGKNAKKKEVSVLFYGGVSLGECMGKLEIQASPRKLHPKVKDLFFDETADHRILSKVFELNVSDKRRVILVTKDMNLRLKAEAIDLQVEDYENDKIPNVDHLYTGKGIIEGTEVDALIEKIYTSGSAPIYTQKHLSCIPKEIKSNMYFILKNMNNSCLVCVDENVEKFCRVEKKTVSGINPRNAEQAFALDALLSKKNSLISLMGKAGTGKTLLAMAAALELLKSGLYERIIIAAAMVPLSNRDIGALPGDANDKVAPYMQGLYDNLEFIKSQYKGKKVRVPIEETEENEFSGTRKRKSKAQTEEKDFISILQEEGRIKIQPLASIRGRSLNNTIFIIDEAQNLTPHEVKTIVTRAGENTKVVFCGDIQQIDSPYLDSRSNGLSHLIYRMAGQKIVAHVTLEKGERSYLAELAADLL